MQLESESEQVFDQAGLRKKSAIRCHVSSSKHLYIVFQLKLFFNLVKELFK